MKKLFACFFVIMLIVSVVPLGAFNISVSAEVEGDYTYIITGGKAIIIDVNTSLSGDVVIPETLAGCTVTSIGSKAFYDCTGLTSITITDNVNAIGSYAFYNCNLLKDVWYEGSETEKSNINISTSNTSLNDAIWHYNTCQNSEHSYKNNCDATCEQCDFVRVPLDHIYDNGCDAVCNECDAARDAGHVYDNNCDAECNVCGFMRTSCDHTYDMACDTVCNECGCERNVYHVYSNDCDEQCNVCGFIRSDIVHTYDNLCDAVCNYCNEIRTVLGHSYTDIYDNCCNECGVNRIVEKITIDKLPDKTRYFIGEAFNTNGMVVSVYYNDGTSGVITNYSVSKLDSATVGEKAIKISYLDQSVNIYVSVMQKNVDKTAPVITVNDTTAIIGKTFDVAIKMINNPGIISFKFDIGYDEDLLEIVSVKSVDFDNITYSAEKTSPFSINWVDSIHPNNQTDGTISIITFKLKENATVGNTVITVNYDSENVFDENFNNVIFETVNAKIEMVDHISGDVNGDGRINNKDLAVLMQYLNGWDVKISKTASDVNADDMVNNRDYAFIMKYINGDNVVLK